MAMAPNDPTMERLEDQIGWYDGKSRTNQRCFKSLKVAVIAAAALIPFFAALGVHPWLTGALAGC